MTTETAKLVKMLDNAIKHVSAASRSGNSASYAYWYKSYSEIRLALIASGNGHLV